MRVALLCGLPALAMAGACATAVELGPSSAGDGSMAAAGPGPEPRRGELQAPAAPRAQEAMPGSEQARRTQVLPTSSDIVIQFPATVSGRYLLVSQTGAKTPNWWSVHDLNVFCM